MSNRLKEITSHWSKSSKEFRAGWRTFAIFEILFKLFLVSFYAPLSAWFLNAVLRSTGDVAVSNFDLISFFASPQGLLLATTFGVAGFALLFVELGGLMLIAISINRDEPISAFGTLRYLGRQIRGFCGLGLRQFVVIGIVCSAALVIAAVTKTALLGGGDIYFYVTVKPPEFWLAISIISTALVIALTIIVSLLVRWILAAPLILLENQSPRNAMTQSRKYVQQFGQWRIIKSLVVWAVGLLLFVLVTAGAQFLLGWSVLWVAGDRVNLVIVLAGLLMAVEFVLSLVIACFASVSFASLVGQIYQTIRPQVRMPPLLLADAALVSQKKNWRLASVVFSVATCALVLAAAFVYSIISQINFDQAVKITAHRGSSRSAPENSMAAVLQAIDDEADYAEIDVQETADGVVVLFHDTDLRRIAGVDKGVWEISYDEFRRLDIGSWFSEEFADQRVVTLAEVIDAVNGRMKLNIEMKFNGHQKQLEATVARIVREREFQEQCVITSLVYRGVEEIARQDEELRRGLIVSAKVGDATRLDVDLLAVNANKVTRDLIRRARRAGMEVHVWTVNEPAQMLAMIHLGVDNIMTDSPKVLRALLQERAEMSNAEKTLLYVSDFLVGRF